MSIETRGDSGLGDQILVWNKMSNDRLANLRPVAASLANLNEDQSPPLHSEHFIYFPICQHPNVGTKYFLTIYSLGSTVFAFRFRT